MRETVGKVSVLRFADWVTPYFSMTHVNTSFEMTQTKGSRSDVSKSPFPKGTWRPPMSYSATFSGSDCILVDCTQEYSPGFIYRNIGKVGSHQEIPTVSISNSDLLNAFPSENDVSKAVIKARNNVADRAASFAESFAEAREAVKSLGALAGNLDRFLVASQKKDWKSAARSIGVKTGSRGYKRAVKSLQGAAGTASNAWMAFNFGIAPIVSDMVSIAILLGGEWDFRVTGSTVLLTTEEEAKIPQVAALGFNPSTVAYTENYRCTAGVQCRLDFEITSEFLAGFAKFGVSDALQLGWALVPSSYLVDFVLPVSEVLRSITATVGLSFRGGSATQFCQIDKKTTDSRLISDPKWKTSFTALEASVSARKMSRRVFDSEPYPVTLWIKDPLQAFPVVTVLSVLGQRLLKLSPKG